MVSVHTGPVDGRPRIAPGERQDIGAVNAVIARAIGAATGGGPPNLFTTLARHRKLYRPWLRFAARLMPGGALPRADSELVILRVAHLSNCDYEWQHHDHLAQREGLTPDDIARVRDGAGSDGWTPRQAAMLAATDELLDHATLSDATWDRLCDHLGEVELIELPMLVGHYQMLGMTLNALRVQPDPAGAEPTGPLGRAALAVARRR